MMGPPDQQSPMSHRVRHPRLLAAFRTALYLTVGTVTLGVALLALATVGFVVSVGALALLVGQADVLAVLVLSGLVVATTAGLVWGLVAAARYLDREVTAADREPDPVEQLKERYVEGDVDEAELERRLERALGPDAAPTGGRPGAAGRAGTVDREAGPGEAVTGRGEGSTAPDRSRGPLRDRARADGRD